VKYLKFSLSYILASEILDKDKTLAAGYNDVTFTARVCFAAGTTSPFVRVIVPFA
jgi:hypothetical protein